MPRRGSGAGLPRALRPGQRISPSCTSLSSLCSGFYRLDDILIACATAEIAFQPVTNLRLARVGMVLHQLGCCHDHARRAKTTLQAVVVPKRLLHWVKLAVLGQPL